MSAPIEQSGGKICQLCEPRMEKIAALEEQVEECEKEIDHWKVQAHSYKPAWDQMKSENLTLEAQVKTLRDVLVYLFRHAEERLSEYELEVADAALAATGAESHEIHHYPNGKSNVPPLWASWLTTSCCSRPIPVNG